MTPQSVPECTNKIIIISKPRLVATMSPQSKRLVGREMRGKKRGKTAL